MRGLAFNFFVLGIVSVLVGMIWGIGMSATGDHTLSPAHAHLNLLGFVLFSVFGFYYHAVPDAAEGVLPKLHFGTAVLSVVIVVPGIVMAIQETGEAMAKVGSLLAVVSMILFLIVVFKSRAAS